MSSKQKKEKSTISEKSIGEEFFLTPAQLSRGVEEGKLTFTPRVFNGSNYKLYQRTEVAEFAKNEVQDAQLKQMYETKLFKDSVKTKKERLEEVELQLDGMDDLRVRLTNEKSELEHWLIDNDAKFRVKYEKEEAVRERERMKAEKEQKKHEKAIRLAQKAQKDVMKSNHSEMMMGHNALGMISHNSSAMYYSQPLYSSFGMLDNGSKKRTLNDIY